MIRSESPLKVRPISVPSPGTVDVLDVPLALTDYAEMLDWIDAMVAARRRGYLCACNVHTVMASRDDPELRAAVLSDYAMNVPDGQPLVWAINALGYGLGDRVYGPELMWRACERAVQRGHRFYLYGGHNQGALVQLSLNLRRCHPGVKIVGGTPPPATAGRGAGGGHRGDQPLAAGVVWVGIGVPKQEKWMAEMRADLEAPVLAGVGAAFDFHAGRVPQAPGWMQEVGLEWAFRLTHEPRRLWKRYMHYNPRFVGSFARQLFD